MATTTQRATSVTYDGKYDALIWVGLLVLAWVFGLACGMALGGECNGWVWNPVQFYRLASSLQSSPWAAWAPGLVDSLKDARRELAGAAVVAAITAGAYAAGGVGAAGTALQATSSFTGSRVGAQAAAALAAADKDGSCDDVAGTMRVGGRVRRLRALPDGGMPVNEGRPSDARLALAIR